MKHIRTHLLLISACIACLLGASCTRTYTYKIGVSQCSSDDWRNKMNEEIWREMIFHPDAQVEIRSADDSNEKQIADIRYFADNGFDIIIAAPNEAEALTPVIREVFDRGIPVLIFDRSINGESYTASQRADNAAIGRTAATMACNLTGGDARAIEIRGLDGSTPAEERHRGFAEFVAEDNRIRVLGEGYGNWTGEEAAVVADSLLRLYPETNVIYAHNDRMAIAAKKVAEALGRPDIRTVGIDAAPEIGIQAVADSIIDATLLYPTNGYELIRTAMAILKGEPFERDKILPSAAVVDISNAEILLQQNEQLKDESEKIALLKGQIDEYWTRHSEQNLKLYSIIVLTVLLSVLIFVLTRAYWNRRRMQEELARHNAALAEQRDQVIALNERLHEATRSKLMFFTNVSHDLRTPLTLIDGPLSQIADSPDTTPQTKQLADIARRNVKILKRLLNQILDFRKYENDKLDMRLTEARLPELLSEWFGAFEHAARTRGLKYTLSLPEGQACSLALDVEKVERVMFNLISNAFKHTPANGCVEVSLRCTDSEAVISVGDTGSGIDSEDLSHIFERFFQADRVHHEGSGIGLALAKAFIELHGGTLTAESTPGKGSTFTVTIPVRHVDLQDSGTAHITARDVDLELGVPDNDDAADTETDGRPTVLVIDDNEDIRNMLSLMLADSYHVVTATDGATGIKTASRIVPDLIICDVMMPGMDGLECCRRLKAEECTSHIPVLMLTACGTDSQRAEGYGAGVDGYLSKPFDADVLRANCLSLIENRRRIKALWDANGTVVRDAETSDSESDFYARFCAIVEEYMSDSELNVDKIAGMLGLGRTQFYRKIKALTNYSPVELIRRMRLSRARKLLMSTDLSIAEIAYSTGFSTPAYFSKCYRDRYGEKPSDCREMQ